MSCCIIYLSVVEPQLPAMGGIFVEFPDEVKFDIKDVFGDNKVKLCLLSPCPPASTLLFFIFMSGLVLG